MRFTVALVQISAGPDKAENVSVAERFIVEAVSAGARLVALPEVFNFVGDASLWTTNAETLDGPTCTKLSELAAEHNIYLLGGSLLESSDDPDRVRNTSVLFGPDGTMLAAYRKMHLFSVTLPDGVVFSEVDHTIPGDSVVTVNTELGRFGMSVCYDLRFPELYRAMMLRGVDLVFAPSAFTTFTGEDHWKVLLRARAIENQVFMLAPNQVGRAATGVEFYGHSMVVDPWGDVLAEGGTAPELVFAEIDTDCLDRTRKRVTALASVRDDLLLKLKTQKSKLESQQQKKQQ